MGDFLSTLRHEKRPRQEMKFFQDNSISKIKEHYEHYKSISDTLAIDDTEFIEIFNCKLDVFEVLDTDNNLLIDGLELFAGMAIFSKIVSFIDKIQFLFGLFDFNGLKSLSRIDLEFLIVSCCTIVHKMFAIRTPVPLQTISKFTSEEFTSDSRINISEFLKWAQRSQSLTVFFKEVLDKPACQLHTILSNQIYVNELKNPASLLYNPRIQAWLSTSKDLFEEQKPNGDSVSELDQCELSPSLDWVYGVRSKDVKQFITCLIEGQETILAYYVSKVVVIYSLKSKKQRHYFQHSNQLIGITSSGRLIASSDMGLNSQIRIWDVLTLETKRILLHGVQQYGCHLIQFLPDTDMLISASLSDKSAVIVTSISDAKVLYTYCCDSPAVQIAPIVCMTNEKDNEFVVASLYYLYWFCLDQKTKTFTSRQFKLSLSHPHLSKITCCAFVKLNAKLPYLADYDDEFEKLVITGHEKGQLFVWNASTLQGDYLLAQSQNQVVKIVAASFLLYVVTDSSYLDIWDIKLERRHKQVLDLTQLVDKANSYDLRDLILMGPSDLLLITQANQFIRMGHPIENTSSLQIKFHSKSYETEFIRDIISLQDTLLCTIFIPSTGILYATFPHGVVIGINTMTHTEVQYWNIGEPIVAADACQYRNIGTIIIVVTATKKTYTRINLLESNEKLQLQSSVRCLKLCPTIPTVVFCTMDNKILSYTINQKGSFIPLEHPLKFSNAIICVRFLEPKSILAVTNRNERFIISLKGDYSRTDTESKSVYDKPTLELLFSWREDQDFKKSDEDYNYDKNHEDLDRKGEQYERRGGRDLDRKGELLPVITGRHCKALIACLPNGQIRLWKTKDDVSFKNFICLNIHSVGCCNLQLTPCQKWLYSGGRSDGMVARWRLDYMIEKSRKLWAQPLKVYPIKSYFDEYIDREITFCQFQNNILEELYDQHLQVRGIRSDTLNKLFKSMLQEWANQNKFSRVQQPPPLSLKLDYVFGIETFHKCNTVFNLFGTRRFVFFVSRVVVVYDPKDNSQHIYQGHRNKVTCVQAVQWDEREVLASGESAFRPKVYIWDPKTLETLLVIKTNHRWGIIYIAHSGSDNIVTYGLQTRQATVLSIELISFKKGLSLAHRTVKHPVYCLAMNPLCGNEFITAEENNVTFWRLEHYNILRTSTCSLGDETATCCLFYVPPEGKEPELLIGTKRGDIGVVTQQRYFIVIRPHAHSRRVNCLIAIERHREPMFVTSGEDEYIRIWSSKFDLLHELELKKIEFQENFKNFIDRKNTEVPTKRNFSVQSISQISGKKQKEELSLLMATRNGDVVRLNEQIQPITATKKEGHFFPFRYTLFLKSNNNQSLTNENSKLLAAHHPRFEILVTIGQDQNLLFWDTERNRFIFSRALAYSAQVSPSAIKFTKDGQYLMIGYSDGLLIFLESKITKSVQTKTDDKYVMPTLALARRFKSEDGCPILNIEVSDSGEHLAVSFNNRMAGGEKAAEKDKFKGTNAQSYITLFINKKKDRGKNFSKLDNERFMFEKFTTISCQFAENTYATQKGHVYGTAAYSMAFTQNEGKSYLLIYYQLIDSKQNRLSCNEGTNLSNFIVWDVNTSTVIANLDLISSLIWKKLCIQSAIYSKYQFYQDLTDKAELGEDGEDFEGNNNLLLPQMTAMVNLYNYILLGSANGDLHLVKASALESDKILEANPSQQQMFVAKTYTGHFSQICKIETNSQKSLLYTTSSSDECVFKWKIQGNFHRLNFESEVISSNDTDIFGQVPAQASFNQVIEAYKAKQRTLPSEFKGSNFLDLMVVTNVLGRKSFTNRNNLIYDCEDKIVYVIGHTIVVYNHVTKKKDFVHPTGINRHFLHEISSIDMSQDKRFVLTSHNGFRATLLVWQLGSKTIVMKVVLNTVSVVLYCKLSYNNRRAIVYALDSKRNSYLLLVDLIDGSVVGIASSGHRPPWIVKAIDFYPNSQCNFVTCGIEQVRKWTLMGNQITYEDIRLNGLSKDFPVINLCLTFVKGILVTGCQNGSIILWKNDIVNRCQHDTMVVVLSHQHAPSEDIFLSGSKDSLIIVWSYVENNTLLILTKILVSAVDPNAEIRDPQSKLFQGKSFFDREIQSLALSGKKILIGTKSGDVLQAQIPAESTPSTITTCRLKFHDNECPNSFFLYKFENSLEIFEITNEGFLLQFRVFTDQILWSRNFNMKTVEMFKCGRASTIYIAFEETIRSFKVGAEGLGLHEVDQHRLELKNITHIQLSPSQKMLAVAICKKSDESKLIEIYDILNQQEAFKFLFRIPLAEPLEMMAFSTTNVALLIKTASGINVKQLQVKRNQNQQLSKVEWSSNGLIFSQHVSGVLRRFSQFKSETRVIRLLRLTSDKLLVFDQFGGITCMTFGGEVISQCTMNISDIHYVHFSLQMKYLVVSSTFDRSVILISLERLLGDERTILRDLGQQQSTVRER